MTSEQIEAEVARVAKLVRGLLESLDPLMPEGAIADTLRVEQVAVIGILNYEYEDTGETGEAPIWRFETARHYAQRGMFETVSNSHRRRAYQ